MSTTPGSAGISESASDSIMREQHVSYTEPTHADPGAVPAPISAGTLFYLWGDREVKSAGKLGGTTLPSGAHVSARQLAPLVFAVSFARLQGDGALRLEATETKTLGFRRKQVQVTPAAQPGHRGGYEQAIVEQVMSDATTAYDVVWRWFGRDTKHPENKVFALAQQEMVQCGLAHVQENSRGGVTGLLLGKEKIEPLPDRVAATWAQFEPFQAWWGSYRRHDPALSELLLETCAKAIRNREKAED